MNTFFISSGYFHFPLACHLEQLLFMRSCASLCLCAGCVCLCSCAIDRFYAVGTLPLCVILFAPSCGAWLLHSLLKLPLPLYILRVAPPLSSRGALPLDILHIAPPLSLSLLKSPLPLYILRVAHLSLKSPLPHLHITGDSPPLCIASVVTSQSLLA